MELKTGDDQSDLKCCCDLMRPNAVGEEEALTIKIKCKKRSAQLWEFSQRPPNSGSQISAPIKAFSNATSVNISFQGPAILSCTSKQVGWSMNTVF